MSKLMKPFLFTASALFLYFFMIPQIPLWSSDEGRYAEIAREMWRMRDFIVPHFNYVDYLEKPIFAPLLTALSFEFFGDNMVGARLVPIISALCGLVLTYYFSRRLFSKKTADMSLIILLTTVGYVLVGRFAVIDMLMTLLLSVSCFCLMAAYFDGDRKLYLWAYVFIGLAFLTKGLIGIVLPGLTFLCLVISQRNWKEITRMHLIPGVLIAGVIIVPWFIAISIREPEFFRVFIVEHHFSRFATGSFGRGKPFWFYIPISFVTAFPWTLFLPAALLQIKKEEPVMKAKLRFLFYWFMVVLIFFSIPKSKLPYYILPLSVPLAVILGHFLAQWRERTQTNAEPRTVRWVIPVFIFICIGGAIGLTVCSFLRNVDPQLASLRGSMRAGAVLLVLGSLATGSFAKKNERRRVILAIAVMVYCILIIAFDGMRRISVFQSTFNEAQIMEKAGLKLTDMVAIDASPDDMSDLPFHLKRRIVVVGNDRGTLTRESQEEDNLEENKEWFYDRDPFVKKFNEGTNRIFLLAGADRYKWLQNSGLKNYRVLSENSRKVLVTNIPE